MCQYAKEKSTKKYEIIDVIKTTENGYLIQQFINAIKSIALSLQYNHNVYPVINNAITKYYDKGILNSNDVISKIHIVKEQISYHYEFFPGDIYTLSEYKQRNIEYSKYIDSLSFSHKPIEEIYYIAIPTTVYFSGKVECTIVPLNVSLLIYIKTKDYLYQKFSEKYNEYINKKIVLPMTYNGNMFNIFLNTVSLENTLISTIVEWLKKVNKCVVPKKYGDMTIATFLSVLKNTNNLIKKLTNEEKLSIINYFDNDSIFKCIGFEFGSESVVCNSLASELMYAILLDKNTLIVLRDNNSPFEIKDGKLYFKEVYLATVPHVQDKRCKYTYINLNVQCYLPMNTTSVKLYIDNNHIPYVKHMQNFISLEKYLLSFYDIKEYDEALTNALKCVFDYNKNIDIVDSVLSNMPQTGNKALHEDNNLIPKLYDIYISTNNVCYILINTLNSDNTYTSHLQLLSEYLSKFKPNRNNNT